MIGMRYAACFDCAATGEVVRRPLLPAMGIPGTPFGSFLGGGAVAVRKAGMEGLTRVDGGCGICRRGIGCGSRGGICGFPFHGFAQESGQFQPYAFAEFMKGQRILYQILDESSPRPNRDRRNRSAPTPVAATAVIKKME